MATSKDLRTVFTDVSALVTRVLTEASAMETLLAKGEEGRTDRSENKPIDVLEVKPLDGGRIVARVQGVEAIYHPRITVGPKRAFSCDCPDSKIRGRKVGPCKHVLALARLQLSKVQPELDRLNQLMVNGLF